MNPDHELKVRIRMYRQGLGDCFLLSFFTGPEPVHVLIDCGTLGSSSGIRLGNVVNDIAQASAGRLHLLVVTHEHKDHVSGFNTARQAFDDDFTVERVWVAWTENPGDELARSIAKHEGDLVAALQLAGDVLLANQAAPAESQALRQSARELREVLNFVGEVPPGDAPLGADFAKTVHEAMSYATRRAGGPPDYLRPGQVIEPAWLPGVRFYVLGPPRDPAALRRLGDHNSPELYRLAELLGADLARNARFHASAESFFSFSQKLDQDTREQFEAGLPFDPCFRLESGDTAARQRHLAAYDDPACAWRRIDYDWLTAALDLALQLDNLTNNTSLVLAVELIDDGRVLLLPADAQLGNWQSWQDLEFSLPTSSGGAPNVVTAADLLARTVFYKVGHHGSHNATLKDNGLEAMTSDQLLAMIPVDGTVAANKKWTMPAHALYTRLLEKTRGRLLRADIGWPGGADRPPTVSQAEWNAARQAGDVSIEPLYIEYRLG
jgi:hypothetical protein